MPASMKSKTYTPSIVATSNDVLCCKCTCQCGSQKGERVLCVHILPLLFLLTLFLFEHLAEHMLLEFAACLNAEIWENNEWSEEDKECMNIILMEAAGEPMSSADTDKMSIKDLLAKFEVGTEKRRTWKQRVKAPPKASELGPIHKMNFMSSSKRAACAVKKCKDASEMEDAAVGEVVWLEEV